MIVGVGVGLTGAGLTVGAGAATTLSLNTESTYDWTGEQWTVPVNVILSQVVNLGNQPTQFFVGGRYYLEAPEEGPEWGVRFGFTLLFPR